MKSLSALVLLMFVSHPAFGKKFANQFVEFEMPANWQCNLEGAEWVCQNSDPDKKRDAIIVLAAKLKGDQDSLDQYLGFLKKSKSYKSVKGKPVKSEVKWAKTAKYQDHNWVDSLHLESEIPGFYTRYLATVKDDIGVLVTYSINKDQYQNYLSEFENLVKTLKVFRIKGVGLNTDPKSAGSGGSAPIPQQVSRGSVFDMLDTPDITANQNSGKKKKSDDELFLIIGLVIAAFVGFRIWKKKRG